MSVNITVRDEHGAYKVSYLSSKFLDNKKNLHASDVKVVEDRATLLQNVYLHSKLALIKGLATSQSIGSSTFNETCSV